MLPHILFDLSVVGERTFGSESSLVFLEQRVSSLACDFGVAHRNHGFILLEFLFS